jgi:hypothetical protein
MWGYRSVITEQETEKKKKIKDKELEKIKTSEQGLEKDAVQPKKPAAPSQLYKAPKALSKEEQEAQEKRSDDFFHL